MPIVVGSSPRAGADAAVLGAVAEEAGLGHFLGVDHARGQENIGGIGRIGNGYVYRGVGGVAALAAEAHADRRNILADGEFIIGALSGYTGCTQETLGVSATTSNRLSATGFTFDSSGNMLTDGLNTYGRVAHPSRPRSTSFSRQVRNLHRSMSWPRTTFSGCRTLRFSEGCVRLFMTAALMYRAPRKSPQALLDISQFPSC